MKWYAYPIAITAYCIYVSMLVAGVFIHFEYSENWYWACGIGVVFLGIAFGLSKVGWSDELKVGLQVALILSPLIYLVNQKTPEQKQVRIFLVPQDYTGKLHIRFVPPEEVRAKQDGDTVYMKFDERGRLALSGVYRKVNDDMATRLFYADSTGRMTPIRFASAGNLPADTSKAVLVAGDSEYESGKVKGMTYILDKPQHIAARLKKKK
ncbi:MAG: hypothetical protein FD123_4170 [Bacteroidetes bacterium]|nr:MAG: hypothetical protein FD123_4170 [Bacteroidota bacterium]